MKHLTHKLAVSSSAGLLGMPAGATLKINPMSQQSTQDRADAFPVVGTPDHTSNSIQDPTVGFGKVSLPPVREQDAGARPTCYDSEVALRAAREAFPFERVLRHFGHAPTQGSSIKNMKCPFCERKKATAGVFPKDGRMFFKCNRNNCQANKAVDEVGYVALVMGLDRREAFREYLQMAGVWREPSCRSGSSVREQEGSTSTGASPLPSALIEAIEPQANSADEPAGCEVRVGHSSTANGLPILERGILPLRAFYEQCMLEPEDMIRLYDKRGLEPGTSIRLGFASNARDNLKLLTALAGRFSTEDLLASGLWCEPNGGEPQPDRQFHGFGIAGRKPEDQRRDSGDKWKWDWVRPILIPYFSAEGTLMKLRPHKGGAKAGTAAGRQMLYVPRIAGQMAVERYRIVVICEGEFKAAALWQTLGSGSQRPQPIGVCAVPGITFGHHVDIMADLEVWLQQVGAQEVLVAFDDEDKSDKPWSTRFDTIKWARVMEVQVGRMHLSSRIVLLPLEWRVSGKADWDSALRLLLSKGNISNMNQ